MASSTNQNRWLEDTTTSFNSRYLVGDSQRSRRESALRRTDRSAIKRVPVPNKLGTSTSVPDQTETHGSHNPISNYDSTKSQHGKGFLSSYLSEYDQDETNDNIEDDSFDSSSDSDSNDNDEHDEDDHETKDNNSRINNSKRKPLHSRHERHQHLSNKQHQPQLSPRRYSENNNNIISSPPYQQSYQLMYENLDNNSSSTAYDYKSKLLYKVQIEQVPSHSGYEEKEKEKPVSSESQGSSLHFGDKLVMFVNLLFPLLLMVLAILHIIKVGRSGLDDFALYIAEANTVAVTVWQIMFAAIAAQAFRAYATFKAERGIRLATLEQLLRSSSFHSAIKQPLLLRRLSWTGIILLFLWTLSPIGSQALQRMAFTIPNGTLTTHPVQYAMPGGHFSIGASDNDDQIARTSLLSTAILTSIPTSKSPQDLWSFPKIPSLVSLQSVSNPSSDGWLTVPADFFNSYGANYTSLMGSPYSLANFDPNIQFNQITGYLGFHAVTGYLSFNCTTPEMASAQQFQFSSTSFVSSQSLTLWLRLQNNDITNTSGTMEWASISDTSGIVAGGSADAIDADIMFAYSKCAFENIIVEAYVNCTSGFTNNGLCFAQNVRPYHGINQTMYQVTWNTPAAQALLQAIPDNTIGTRTLQELYLADPAKVIGEQNSDFSALTNDVFTDRAQILVNTFYQVAGSGSAFTEGLGADTDDPRFSVDAVFTDQSPVWAISKNWIGIFFLCNTIILLLALADIFCRAMTISPDFLGFAGSHLRKSKGLYKERSDRKLSGHEKARELRSVNVMLQDVKPNAVRGKIALAPIPAQKDWATVKLRKDRSYR